MKILAGRHLTRSENANGDKSSVKVLGLNAFHDTRLNFHRAYLDCDWGMRTVAFVGSAVPLMADIAVSEMMKALQASYPERRQELLEMLSIDSNWRMHQLSDGQRRRVQIFLGLIRPFKILLLDEITTSLDVCVRQDLLRWLVRESDERGATIIYATHIFDGLDDWASHLFYLTDTGSCGWQGKMQDLEVYQQLKRDNHPAKMLAIAEHWLRKELDARRVLNLQEEAQGAEAHALDPTDKQGGFSSGRLKGITTDTSTPMDTEPETRRGRLSDVMGNAGVLEKVRRVGGE
jgi:CCR4-NOT complex subunit CAF16